MKSPDNNIFSWGKLDNWVSCLGTTIGTLCLIIVLISIFSQVLCRFLFGFSLTWSEEAGRYLLCWLSFIVLGAMFKEKRLMSVTIITDRMSGKKLMAITVLRETLILFFLVVVLYYGFSLVRETMVQSAVVTGIPMGYIYSAVPLGAGFYIFHLITRYANRNSR